MKSAEEYTKTVSRFPLSTNQITRTVKKKKGSGSATKKKKSLSYEQKFIQSELAKFHVRNRY